MSESLFETNEQPVVFRFDARLQIGNGIRSTDNRIEYGTDGTSNDEVRAEVVQVVCSKHVVASKLTLNSEIELLDHRVLHRVVDDIDAPRSGAGKDESRKWIRQSGRSRWKLAHHGIEWVSLDVEEWAGPHVNWQSTSVQSAFKRLNFQGNAVVINAVSTVNT